MGLRAGPDSRRGAPGGAVIGGGNGLAKARAWLSAPISLSRSILIPLEYYLFSLYVASYVVGSRGIYGWLMSDGCDVIKAEDRPAVYDKKGKQGQDRPVHEGAGAQAGPEGEGLSIILAPLLLLREA